MSEANTLGKQTINALGEILRDMFGTTLTVIPRKNS